MSSKAEKERAKALQEKFQAILSSLLKDDDNKYCVDCDAKGPRWASHNLGIFLCIRCAGIHRNLGVHISKVKSVNLDSWTPEQVAMMQEVGNSRARAAYEANIPDNFRRPQTDSALEAFIRAKYETKKYIAREWVPPRPVVPKEWLEDERDKRRSRPKQASSLQLNSKPKPSSTSNTPSQKTSPDEVKSSTSPPPVAAPTQQPQTTSAAADLIGLEASSPTGQQANGGSDLLADIFGGSPPAQATSAQSPAGTPQGAQQNGSIEASLFEDPSADKGPDKSTKESILALYGSAGGGQQSQQMFGVPAVSDATSSNDDLLQFTSVQGGFAQTSKMSSNQMPPCSVPANQIPPCSIPTNQMPCSPTSANGLNPFQQDLSQPQMCFVPYYYDAGGMYMPQQGMGMYGGGGGMQQPQQGVQYQQGMMGMQQPNMYGMNQMAAPMQGQMMGQQQQMGGNMMMGGQQQQMFQQQQQQQMQYQQMQQQMAAMKLAGGAGQMGGMPQGGAAGWGMQNSGQTLSTNLWQ